MKTLLGAVDRFNEKVAKLSAWAMLLLVLTMTYEVVSRYVFGHPTLWSYDVSYMLGSITIIMGMAYTLKIKGHVSIDIFFNKMPRRIQALLYVIFSLTLFFLLWGLMVKVMLPHVMMSFATHERSWIGTWQPIVYPFKAWVTIGTIMLLIQGIAELIRDFYVLVTGGERP